MKLERRLAQLEAEVREVVGDTQEDIDREWWPIVRRSPELRETAVDLAQRQGSLWPDRPPTAEEVLDDPVCRDLWLKLASEREGGLANLLALGFG